MMPCLSMVSLPNHENSHFVSLPFSLWFFSCNGSDGEGQWEPSTQSSKGTESVPVTTTGWAWRQGPAQPKLETSVARVNTLIEALWVRWWLVMVCLDPRGFLGCGTSRFKARNILGKQDESVTLLVRDSEPEDPHCEITNVCCFKLQIMVRVICDAAIGHWYNIVSVLTGKPLIPKCVLTVPSSEPLQYSGFFPVGIFKMLPHHGLLCLLSVAQDYEYSDSRDHVYSPRKSL